MGTWNSDPYSHCYRARITPGSCETARGAISSPTEVQQFHLIFLSSKTAKILHVYF